MFSDEWEGKEESGKGERLLGTAREGKGIVGKGKISFPPQVLVGPPLLINLTLKAAVREI